MRNFNYTHNFYECNTWSITLREKCRLRVFDSRRLFGPKREVRGGWINYIMGKFFTVYCEGDQIKEDEIRRACGAHGREDKYTQHFIWKV
jgi:hypothetical protein